MKQGNVFLVDILDFDDPNTKEDRIWVAYRPTKVISNNGDVLITIPFQAQQAGTLFVADPDIAQQQHTLRLRAYGNSIIRMSVAFAGELLADENPMLDLQATLQPEQLTVAKTDTGWEVLDSSGQQRAILNLTEPQTKHWSDLVAPPQETLEIVLYPDSMTAVPLMAQDQFYPGKQEALPLAYLTRADQPNRAVFAFHATPDECFAGTGERFAKLDLAGRTLTLENEDGLGVNSRRAYKNIPFFLSNRPYGIFMHTSHHIRLSLTDISTRSVQGMIEEPIIDLFVIGGGTVERVVYNYRRITGFPSMPPLWSFGTWMSRMTYFTADEVRTIARRLRDEAFPCDVLHLDTGWFAQDWICEWEFSQERFPDPAGFMQEMRDQGFRVTLWQTPNIGEGNRLLPEAEANRYISMPDETNDGVSSDFSAYVPNRQIDFSNPEAVDWYKGLLERVLQTGASAMKTDFGEDINLKANYATMPPEQLHNLYALLYQKFTYEITKKLTGEGIIWARSAWAGCQRYPLHWGGDAACTWDGMAGTLRGGLHFGLSGFAFWSHDVPGFHGVPDFMNSWPSDELYLRWTQFGVFTSHLRYHGTQPREPYEYPNIEDTVRQWLRLRYALIPYILQQSEKALQTGLPVLRALIFHHEDDPTCWHIDDQYYFGDDFIVAPIMNNTGSRRVYLPEGDWIDFWRGDHVQGRQWLMVDMPLEQMPLYVRAESTITFAEPVQHTGELEQARRISIKFDNSYHGLMASELGIFVQI